MVQGPTRDHPSQNHTEDRSSVSLEHPAEQPSASRVLDMQQNEMTPSCGLSPEGASNEESPNSLPLEGGGAGFAAGDAATEGVEKQLPQSRHWQNAECLASSPEEEPKMRIASLLRAPKMRSVWQVGGHSQQNGSNMKKTLYIAAKVLRITVMVLVGILVVVNVYLLIRRYAFHDPTPTVFGLASANVETGSMKPLINEDDFVFTRAQDSYAVGDIVMYQTTGSYGETIAVTHQIIEIDENGNYITKGVNNQDADIDPVSPEQVVGKVFAVWHGFGKVAAFFRSPAGICVLLIAAVGVWLLIDLIPGGKKKEIDEQEAGENN